MSQVTNFAIADIQCRIYNGEDLLDKLIELKTELQVELLREAKGAQIRAHTLWEEEGEASTAYFLRQEKSVGKRCLIDRIKRKDSSIANTTEHIITVWHNFYLDLFSTISLDENEQSLFLDSLERTLTKDQSIICDGPITIEECYSSLKSMATGKSSGIDGFSTEFFLCFWDILGEDLVNVFNSCYDNGSLTPSQWDRK